MEFIPFVGTILKDFVFDFKKTGDVYYNAKALAKMSPKPKVFGTNVMDKILIKLNDPELIKEFFMKHECYSRNLEFIRLFKLAIGDGLFSSDDEVWKKNRKFFNNSLHFEFLANALPGMFSNSVEAMQSLQNGDMKQVSTLEIFQCTAGEIIAKVFFGDEFIKYRIKGERVPLYVGKIFKRLGQECFFLPSMILGPSFVKMKLLKRHKLLMADIEELRNFCETYAKDKLAEIEANYKQGVPLRKNYLLEVFYETYLANKQEGGDDLSLKELVDDLTQLLLGGTESSTNTATMCTWYALKYPEFKAKLLEEMSSVLKPEEPDFFKNLTMDDMKMPFTTAFIKETLRLSPPAPMVMERNVIKDHYLGDFPIKKGTSVNISIIGLGYDPSILKDAETFNPYRWLDPNSEINQKIKENPFIFIPFGAGPNKCLGQNLAILEIKIMLSLFMLQYDYKLSDPNYELKMGISFVYGPDSPIQYELTKKF